MLKRKVNLILNGRSWNRSLRYEEDNNQQHRDHPVCPDLKTQRRASSPTIIVTMSPKTYNGIVTRRIPRLPSFPTARAKYPPALPPAAP